MKMKMQMKQKQKQGQTGKKIIALILSLCAMLNVVAMADPPMPSWANDESTSRYDAPPLPDDEADRISTRNDASSPDDDTAAASDDNGNAPASDSASSSANTATSAPAEAPLEGPPTPLPAMARLEDTSPANSGLPPDRPISLNFQRADITAVLQAFAQFTHLNIIASERVRGQVTLRLDKVPWRTAFDMLLDTNGLAMERRSNVIWVTQAADLAAREKQRFEAHARAAELEPLVSRTFELHYAHAVDVQRVLAGSGNQRALSKRGSVVADTRTNLLFVTDLAARLDQIADLIAKLDRPTRQVQIEARIVEGEEGLSRELGVRLSAAVTGDGTGTGVHGSEDGTMLDLPAGSLSGFNSAQIGFSLLVAGATRLLDVELSALEAEGRGHIVSSPSVVTADRTKAVIEQGMELPYQAKVSQGVSGVQFRRASLRMEVEPQITPDGQVILDLDVAKDSVGEQTAAGPAINTKHVKTRVEVENGGTVSIGGIDASDERDDVTRVPFLGKIPILGVLFSHRAHRGQHTELVVLITPRIVEPKRQAH